MKVTSKKIDDKDIKLYYTGYFEIDKKGTEKNITEHRIVSEEIAEKRAIAEFIEFGLDKQTVSFTTYFSPLKINDIIKIYAPDYRIPKDLTKERFIIKDIKHSFKSGEITTNITGVRYD